MRTKQAKQIASAAISKAQRDIPAGTWSTSFDRKGRPIRMFVPAGEAK